MRKEGYKKAMRTGIEGSAVKRRWSGGLILLICLCVLCGLNTALACDPVDCGDCGYWDEDLDQCVPYEGNECAADENCDEHYSCNASCICICSDTAYYDPGTEITPPSNIIVSPGDGEAFPVGEDVSFSCCSCSDSDVWCRCEGGEWKETSVDDPIAYLWSGGGQSGTGTSFTLVAPPAGSYSITVTAYDTPKYDDFDSYDAVIIDVVEVASLDADKYGEVIGDFVTFTATTYPPGHEYMISWSGGGSPSSQTGGATFVTRWAGPGTYTVRATCGTSTKLADILVGPNSEYTTSPLHTANMAEFAGQLSPGSSVDYTGHKVQEKKGGDGYDYCYWQESDFDPWTEVTPPPEPWTLTGGGFYGPDMVGWFDYCIVYYRGAGRAPCNNMMIQDMEIDTTYGVYKYKTNALEAHIGVTTLKSFRDGVPEGPWPWP